MLRQIDPPPATEPMSRHCGNCGYDLRGIAEPRCPECGVAFDPFRPPVASVPWFHRRTIGHAAALWRTWCLVAWRPGRLAEEVWLDSELNVCDAAAFRRICVGVAGCSAALALMLVFVDLDVLAPAVAIALGPALVVFHMVTLPIDDRAVLDSPARTARFATLYPFTAAPLLLLPLPAIAFSVARLTGRDMTAAVLLSVSIVAHWLICTFAYQKRATRRGRKWLLKRILVSVAVWAPLAWFTFILIMLIAQELLWRPHGRR
jgi:hypothetical protein